MSSPLPPAQRGRFRLFRLLALYPTPKIEIRTFPYPDRNASSSRTAAESASSRCQDDICPPYDAISYTWNPNPAPELDEARDVRVHLYSGSPDPAHLGSHDRSTAWESRAIPAPIHVPVYSILVASNTGSDAIITITGHLMHALLTAQELCAPTWLFVDAICIDQTDSQDKTTQVQCMDQVFRGAGRVFIWLGVDVNLPTNTSTTDVTHTEGSTASVMILGACLPQIPLLAQALEAYLSSRERPQSQDNSALITESPITVLGLPSKTDALWPALERLRLNPWFTRLWVVQEMTLSQEAVLLYGRHALPWSVYAKLTSLCQRIITSLFSQQHASELVNQLYFAYNSRVSAMMRMQNLASRARLKRREGRNVPDNGNDEAQLMRTLIHLVRKSKASMSLDRVYAVMGLLSDAMRENIRVDYSYEMMDQYWTKWIELVQSMLFFVPAVAEDLFSLAAYLDRHPHLPSWCPNLADNEDDRRISDTSANCAGMPRGERWRGPEDVRATAIIPGTQYVRLLGSKIDEVAHVIDLSWIQDELQWVRFFVDQNSDMDSDVARKILVMLRECLEFTNDWDSTTNRDAVLARCLVANAYDGQVVEPELLLQDYTAFTHFLWHYASGGPVSGAPFKESTKTAALRYGNRFQHMARKRAFFATNTGQSGLCSFRAEKGDSLCVFMNYRSPYLVRRHGESTVYEFVGEVYVDGLMHGEGFAGRDMVKESPDEFIIR